MSSPLAYPPTSSPQPHHNPPCKKRKLQEFSDREPLQSIVNESNTVPRSIGSFLMEDDSDEDFISTKPSNPQMETYWQSLAESQDHVRTSSTQRLPRLLDDDKLVESHQVSSGTQDSGICMDITPNYPRRRVCTVRDCSGRVRLVSSRVPNSAIHYERIVAERSIAVPGRAAKSYYGINVHELVDAARKENEARKILAEAEPILATIEVEATSKPKKSLLWTEKYRARKFTDLVGDERTHRSVLRWLKGWDPIVFPHQTRPKASRSSQYEDKNQDRQHRKILLLTGPPGLGKTTLAHVCAKQAGYEVKEINASDDRSSNVVKGQIRDMLGTENVRSVDSGLDGKMKRAAKPVCVIVDEVDGVVTGSGASGEGGFIKALVDLLALDHRNCSTPSSTYSQSGRKRTGDKFRMLRPLILVCNDVYHSSLRLLRQGTFAETIHIRKAPLQMVAPRLQAILTKEGVPCDSDGVRALCEATWGINDRKEDRSQSSGTGDGDMRSILVTGEWVAGKLRAAQISADDTSIRLSKKWLMQNVLNELAHGGQASRSLGRGGSKEVVERVFLHNAGFSMSSTQSAHPSNKFKKPQSLSADVINESSKCRVTDRLTEMIGASGEDDRIMSDIWTAYPTHPFQDDTVLSKPSRAYDWLHFHSLCSERVHTSQEWELSSYLSYPILAFHLLFAGNSRHKPTNTFNSVTEDAEKEATHPLTTIRAAYVASEALRANRAILSGFHHILSLPMQRHFGGPEDLATDLVPYVLRILNPDVKPVVVGGSERGVASVRKGSEKEIVCRSVQAMVATGLRFEKTRVEFAADAGNLSGSDRAAQSAGFVYRMEPPVDDLGIFGTASKGFESGKVRYAVRQVLDQEHRKEMAQVERATRQRRANAGLASDSLDFTNSSALDSEAVAKQTHKDAATAAKLRADKLIKRDFFGRPIAVSSAEAAESEVEAVEASKSQADNSKTKALAAGTGMRNQDQKSGRIWVTYHEGYSNAVRRGITMAELLSGL